MDLAGRPRIRPILTASRGVSSLGLLWSFIRTNCRRIRISRASLMIANHESPTTEKPGPTPSARARRRAGSLTSLSAAAFLTILVVAGGGAWYWWQNRDVSSDDVVLLHTVARDDFELTVTERGEIEAFDVTEIRSLVKSNNTTGNAILKIVPEGTAVKKGDFLVELDSSALAAQRTSQKILVNAAKALEVEAHNNYDVAVIAKKEYLEGTYP